MAGGIEFGRGSTGQLHAKTRMDPVAKGQAPRGSIVRKHTARTELLCVSPPDQRVTIGPFHVDDDSLAWSDRKPSDRGRFFGSEPMRLR